ncbi:hypothetical protein K438DRAFT_1746803 [Mycena galopus ATCC 62051]|nr:hypothetical protein K438DRAFT_1746803 [Mycena galopus ATCC 62051]
MLSDVHALVVKLQACLVAQEEKIAFLQQENAKLWQEIIQVIKFGGIVPETVQNPRWLKDFLPHLPKFRRLTTLALQSMSKVQDFEAIDRDLPLATKQQIHELQFRYTENITMSAFGAFISQFTNLTVLTIWWTRLEHNKDESLVPPPSSIKKLFFVGAPEDSPALKWFTDLHYGVLESFYTDTMQLLQPAIFGPFACRFGATLSEMKLEMVTALCEEEFDNFIDSRDFIVLREFKALKRIVMGSCIEDLDKLSKMLAELPQSIQEICIRLWNGGGHDAFSNLESFAASCSQLDRTLAGTKLPCLRKLAIEIPPTLKAEECIDVTRNLSPQILPCCAQNQNLTIDFRPTAKTKREMTGIRVLTGVGAGRRIPLEAR